MNSLSLKWMRMTSYMRLEHWRGRGVHSPFAYNFTREAFMQRHAHCKGDVYESLLKVGIGSGSARLAQAAYTYLDCRYCTLNGFRLTGFSENGKGRMEIFAFLDKKDAIPDNILRGENVVCLLSPFSNDAWYEICRKAVDKHPGMSIDCRGAVFLFSACGLNREHIKL